MKRFLSVHPETFELNGDLRSKNAREAALKVASKDVHKHIILVEDGKMHIFEGQRIALEESQHTKFTREKNITTKPHVRKMAYTSCEIETCKNELARTIAKEWYTSLNM